MNRYFKGAGLLAVAVMMVGCGIGRPQIANYEEARFYSFEAVAPGRDPPQPRPVPRMQASKGSKNSSSFNYVRNRRFSKEELLALSRRDPDLSPSAAKEILARLNRKDSDYIQQDIDAGMPIKVPDDFTGFKNWTPLPKFLRDASDLPQFILVVKDLPFLGWYANGRLIGDSYTCIGKEEDSTRAGYFTVMDKDENHVSLSYTNAWGKPAPMPWALRVYEHVWIHAGDITGGNCSHGCINLPIPIAMKLFSWAKRGAPVLISEELSNVTVELAEARSRGKKFAIGRSYQVR